MEQGRFREAVSHAACQEMFPLFMEPVSGHYPKPTEFRPHTHTHTHSPTHSLTHTHTHTHFIPLTL